MSDISASFMYNLSFSSTRGVRQQSAQGDWTSVNSTWLSAIPCCVNRMTEAEATIGGDFQGRVTDVLNCPAGTDVIRGDVITVSTGLKGRVMEVYDASNRGHHLICYLDRREYGG